MSDLFDEPQPRENMQSPRRHTGRNVLLVFSGIVLLSGLVAGGYIYNLTSTFNASTHKIESAFPNESTRPSEELNNRGPEAQAVNILLMGADAGSSSTADLVQGNIKGSRTDTLMLMHIPPDRQNVYVMSIMRDLWTEIPGHGEHKVNSALALGGISLTVQTVEGLFDERIDHVAVIDFEGFKGLTTALNGVTVDVPATFSANGYMFEAGPMELEGEQALTFVRERKAFSTGDYQRVENQQIFVKAILSKFLTAETLTSPQRISDVVHEFSPYLSVDNEFDAGAVARLALSLRGVGSTEVEMFTLPTNGVGVSADGQSIVVKDQQAIEDIARAFDESRLADYLLAHGL